MGDVLMAILTAVWGFLNSPVGITAVAGVVLLILNRIYAKKPLWQTLEGTIIGAVKTAEKAIPDDAENAGMKRLDYALKYVLSIYEEVVKRRATDQEQAAIRDGIQVVHDRLDASGTL